MPNEIKIEFKDSSLEKMSKELNNLSFSLWNPENSEKEREILSNEFKALVERIALTPGGEKIVGLQIVKELMSKLNHPSIELDSSSKFGLGTHHELMEDNKGPLLIGGKMNINEKELTFMLNKYAEIGAGFDRSTGRSSNYERNQRELNGQKFWEDKSGREQRQEFFESLQNDLGMFAKTNDEKKFNFVVDKALNRMEPLSGFYQTVLIKNGATIDKDGAIEVLKSVKRAVSELGRRGLHIKDILYFKSHERQYELQTMNLGKTLKPNF